MSSSSSANSLRPAWHRGSQSGAKGFQPPPTVATSERGRSASIGAAPSEAHRRDSNFNAFAALDDDDDNNAAAAAGDAPPPEETTTTTTKQQAPPPPRENSRSEALRTAKTTRSMSAGGKSSGGRSLADLAARVPPERNHSRFSSLSMRYSGGGGGDSSSAADYDAAAGKYEQQQQAKVIRYTREKLLSMRPTPKSALPDALKEFEGAVILSESAQDPVCWDTFDAEAIWASVPRRASTKAADGTEGGVRRMSSRRDSGGRWQRGVALPPPDQAGKKGREKDASNPNELWDDPAQTAAASDFSAFGGIPDDEETFDLDKMAEATRKFEEELHGSRSRASSNADSEEFGNTHSVKVDPKRPLASVGTTIRAGSGDNVNVFEDFDEPGPEEEKKETPAIKAGDEDPSASSRLMAMIGVKKEAPPETAAAPERETPESEAKAASPWGDTSAQPKAADGMAIPLNPWGTGIATSAPQSSVAPHGLDIQAQLHEAAELERKKREEEEMRRRKEQEEAQRRLSQQKAEELARQAAIQQQQQQHQQHQQQQAGVQSQVELVLLERISTILENSWGRADLMTILSTLHAEDARVIPLLNNVDALRALIMRNPRRITLRHDPSVGVEVAVLVATNAQWQQQQQQQQLQQQQQEAQARAQEEQLRLRQEQQRRLEEQQKAAAAKAAAAAAPPPVSPDAPWYYSDPQNNIQGPFRGNEMRQWLEAGYFKGDLPISQQPNGPFSPLSVIFPDLSVAFQVPSDPAADAARAKAEAEEKERQEAAERARAKAEAEAKAREAAERERQAQQEAAERERRKAAQEAENAKKAASGKKANGGNESSAQLKMMLGLPSQGDGIPSTPNEKQPEESAAKGAERRPSKASGKNAAASKVSHPSADTASTSNKAPSSAWGGAAKPATRKSMSEIQKEEARAAAIAAMQREGSRSSSSGWANVAASRGGSTAWSGGAVKHAPPAVLTSSSNAAPASTAARPRQQSLGGSKPRTGGAPQQRSRSTSNAAEEFGAKMSPALESWCKDQMLKLNGTDDLTLVSFCMTLNDASEIRQYLTAYLGSTPQVNNFATEFINKKGLGKGAQEEWETTGTAKKSRKKKTSSR